MGVLHAEFVQAVQNHMNDDAVLRFVLRRAARSRGTKLSGEQLGHCVAAIKQAIESGADSVVIDGGPSMDLDLTAENISQAFAEFETESAELVERCVLNSVREISPNVLESLYKDAPRALAERRRRRRSFERHLQRRWALGLNRLEMLLIIAEEAGATFLRRLNNDDPNDVFADDEEVGESTCEAIVRLHARACRTAAESLCLLNGGYSDGATARWRSLHELAVTAMFLREQSNQTAHRFLEHAAVDRWKSAQQYQVHCARLAQEPFSQEELAVLERDFNAAVAKFGPQFKHEYGWAVEALQNPKPTFAEIERNLSFDHWRPYFRMACHGIHAGSQGLFFALGLVGDSDQLLAGASNAGLADPGHLTAISLTMATASLVTIRPELDDLVTGTIMNLLTTQIGDAFLIAQDTLEREAAEHEPDGTDESTRAD